MKNRTPVPRDQRPALPDFAPVPRRYRHDGWTPERQKAFIEAEMARIEEAVEEVKLARNSASNKSNL